MQCLAHISEKFLQWIAFLDLKEVLIVVEIGHVIKA